MSATDDTPPSAEAQSPLEQAEHVASLVKQAVALLGLTSRKLTSSQRRHGLKFRKGAEPHILRIVDLSDTHGIVVPGLPTSGVRASLARITALQTVRLALVSALAVVDDTIYGEQGSAYGTSLTLYGMLKKVGHRHAQIRATLEPVRAFFSFRGATEEDNAKRREATKEKASARKGATGTLPREP